MTSLPAETGRLLRRVLRPPLGDASFWAVQATVVALAGLHLLVDLETSGQRGAFPGGIPVTLLVIPVAFAAVRYGLAGSAATWVWAILLWLPDLLLPDDRGHVGTDLIDLALVGVVAFFLGQRIEAERIARAREEQATAERLDAERGYRELFEANRAPIVVADRRGTIQRANHAALVALGPRVIGTEVQDLLGGEVAAAARADRPPARVLHLPDGRDYRVRPIRLSGGPGSTQVVLEDVTEERAEGRRATRTAALVVATEEEQRRRLARELHDEPLQLFVHLARRLEVLGEAGGVPPAVADGLRQARAQAIDAAGRLRNLARDLRPPALDRLGLVPALSSLLADVEEESGLSTALETSGTPARLAPNIELGAFRIVQEAVRNTVRHARAAHLSVTVAAEPPWLRLTVADDGQGFHVDESSEDGSHFGLVGMTERARLLGGKLDARSVPGEGTVVAAVLPFHGGPDAGGGGDRTGAA